jgi:drug/metabolite transporter (DMT)-like permease
VSATGFLLWNSVMKVHPVGKVSLFLFLIPLFGSLLSSVLLHESFSPYTLAGLLLVTGGIVIVNRSPARTQKGETGCPAESN